MDSKIKSVDFTGQDDIQAAIEEGKRRLELTRRYMTVIAQERKIKYDAYFAVGFTAEQALDLCKVNY